MLIKMGRACPKCKFVSYGARFVYGNKAYKFAQTQQPWKDKKLFEYEMKLYKEIKDTNELVIRRQTFLNEFS